MRISLDVPAETAAGVPVAVRLVVENVGARQLDLYLRGRIITFDIVVMDAAGATVWRRLEGEVVPAILRIEPLAPGAILESHAVWDQRDRDGRVVPPGDYAVRGELLTEAAPLSSDIARLRIVP